MRKRFTKIICAAVAAISALGVVFASGCGNYKWKAVTEKDNTASQVQSNGGFAVQTGDYVYFINGKTSYTANNTFGSVLKGSVQRIKKTDLAGGNYASTQTIVPSVIYSGQFGAGIYIYGDYIYYTTPSTQKDGSGNILNTTLDFKRTTLDGAETSRSSIWQCTDNTVDYRIVEEDGTVYILYAIAENLYGTSATNIHSVNCETGENTLLAYNVDSYLFDSGDPTNPVAYYTMNVPWSFTNVSTYGYNQVYRVSAGTKESPREYDYSDVDNYNAKSNPVYVNYGDYVFDGIGSLEIKTDNRITQLNYAYWSGKDYELTNSDYKYTLNRYSGGTLYYSRTETIGSSMGIKYMLKDSEIDADNDKKVDDSWDAVEANAAAEKFLYLSDTTDYVFIEMGGKTYAIYASANGITKGEVVDGVVNDSYTISEDASADILFARNETTEIGVNTYLYYSLTGGNGFTFHRLAIDGEESDYKDLPDEEEWDTTWTYRGVPILDLDASTDWYIPEFVGNTLLFCSETYGMSSYNYVMACNLDKDGKMLTNAQIHALNEKYEKVTETIEKYDDETNTDGTLAYENLSNALKYLWYTGDEAYLEKLIKAYVDIEGRDEEYLYSKRSVEIYHEYAQANGDWEDYGEDSRTINGKTVYANSHEYYYSVLGRMTDSDADGLNEYYKSQYMQSYPVDNSTWWEKLSTGGKAGFIIGMVAIGLIVCAGIAIGTLYLVKYIKKKKTGDTADSKIAVDITDDKDVNVYDDTAE